MQSVNSKTFNSGPFSFLHATVSLTGVRAVGVNSLFQITDSTSNRPQLISNML